MLTLTEWLATRPESVQRLADQFPAGMRIMIKSKLYFVVGWTENDKVIVSPVDPGEDYDAAVRQKSYICAEHLPRSDP